MEVMQPKARTGPAWANDEPAAKGKKKKQESKTEEVPEGVSDVEWMRRRMKDGVEGDKTFEQDDQLDDAEKPAEVDATILQTGRLFVRNLAFSCTEHELTELFSPYGELSQVRTMFLRLAVARSAR